MVTRYEIKNGKGELYAPAGMQITIISKRGEVWIVEAANGNRFAIREEQTAPDPIKEEKPPEVKPLVKDTGAGTPATIIKREPVPKAAPRQSKLF